MAETDKIRLGYLPVYRTLAEQIGPAGRVCEIGVYYGGSLELWQRLFPAGHIVGVDINTTAVWPPGTVKVVCDQIDPGLPELVSAAGKGVNFDLIVEDASHDGDASKTTWGLLWPLVRPGGYYVVEDWMVGFPSSPVLQHSPSMLDFARGLLDRFVLSGGDVQSVTYRYGLIILQKAG